MATDARSGAGVGLALVLVVTGAMPAGLLAAGQAAAGTSAGPASQASAPQVRSDGRQAPAWTPPASVAVEYAPRPAASAKAGPVFKDRVGWDPARMQRKQQADGTVVIDLGGQGRQFTRWSVDENGVGALHCDSRLEAASMKRALRPGDSRPVPQPAPLR